MATCQICRAHSSHVEIAIQLEQGTTEISLCHECAESYKLDAAALEKESLASFLKKGLAIGQAPAPDETESLIKACPNCGISHEEVVESGKVGCPFCYFVFNHLPEVRQRAGSGNSRLPECTYDSAEGTDEPLEILQRRLDEAIANEHFEVAAELRDQINARL